MLSKHAHTAYSVDKAVSRLPPISFVCVGSDKRQSITSFQFVFFLLFMIHQCVYTHRTAGEFVLLLRQLELFTPLWSPCFISQKCFCWTNFSAQFFLVSSKSCMSRSISKSWLACDQWPCWPAGLVSCWPANDGLGAFLIGGSICQWHLYCRWWWCSHCPIPNTSSRLVPIQPLIPPHLFLFHFTLWGMLHSVLAIYLQHN